MADDENAAVQQDEQTETEPMHTAAEADLLDQVKKLTDEVAQLRAENKKLFLRLGGSGSETASKKTPDDEIKEMLKRFQSSGYDPSTLYDGR